MQGPVGAHVSGAVFTAWGWTSVSLFSVSWKSANALEGLTMGTGVGAVSCSDGDSLPFQQLPDFVKNGLYYYLCIH